MEKSTVLRVRLTPKGGKNAVMRVDESGVLHARVSAPPVDGAANRALIQLISDALKIPKSRIEFQSGEASREKSLRVNGLCSEELRELVDAAVIAAMPTRYRKV